MKLSIARSLATIALCWTIVSLLQPAVAAPTVTDVATQLICDCPDCGGKTLDQCPTCGTGKAYRDEIAALLAQGRTTPQILDTFADKYGEHMLASPRNKGIGRTAIAVPFVLLGLGLIPVIGALRRRQVAPAQPAQRKNKSKGDDSEDPRLSAALQDFDF